MEKQEIIKTMKLLLLASLLALALSGKPSESDSSGMMKECSNDGTSLCNIIGGQCLEECPDDYDFGVKCHELCPWGRCSCCFKVPAEEGDPCGENGLGTCRDRCLWYEMSTTECNGGKTCCMAFYEDDDCALCVPDASFCQGQYAGLGNIVCDDLSACCQCDSSLVAFAGCLRNSFWCDGTPECMNGFDENYCPSSPPAPDDVCGEGSFQCWLCIFT